MTTDRRWLILREPGKVPERKGPFRPCELASTLREFMAARPSAFITVLSIAEAGPSVQDGPECLEMLDARSKTIAHKHRASTKMAFAHPDGFTAYAIKHAGRIDLMSISDSRGDLLSAINRPAGQSVVEIMISEVTKHESKDNG